MFSRTIYRALIILLIVPLVAACTNKTNAATPSAGQGGIMNLPAATHAAAVLNDKYKILSRTETKELEWRNAILMDQMTAQLPQSATLPMMPMFNAIVQTTVSDKEAKQCEQCRQYVVQQLAVTRSSVPEPFTAAKLIAYDVKGLPEMYLANAIMNRCQSVNAANINAQLMGIEGFLIGNGYITQATLDAIKAKPSFSENFSCSNPIIMNGMAMGTHRIARLTDNIAFSQEHNAVR